MNGLAPVGRLIILFGIILVIVGLFLTYGPKIPYLGKLPGDIHIKKENFRFYFPIATCIIISIILTLIFYIVGKFRSH